MKIITNVMESLENQLKAKNEEIEHLAGWLKAFAQIEDESIDDIDIWIDDEMQEACTNLESRLDVAEMNIQILKGEGKALKRIIAAQKKTIELYEQLSQK